MLRLAGFIWGITGVMALLLSAIIRLTPRVLELRQHSMSIVQWGLLIGFLAYMLYAEGYKGFHRNFAPRVALRADYLRREGKLWMCLLAPFICMGYLFATRRRQLVSIILTLALIALIVLVSHLHQPWRGIIDAGVVAGLATGVLSLGYFSVLCLLGRPAMVVSADLPAGLLTNQGITQA